MITKICRSCGACWEERHRSQLPDFNECGDCGREVCPQCGGKCDDCGEWFHNVEPCMIPDEFAIVDGVPRCRECWSKLNPKVLKDWRARNKAKAEEIAIGMAEEKRKEGKT